jgi:hypothetical protein
VMSVSSWPSEGAPRLERKKEPRQRTGGNETRCVTPEA